MVVVSDIIKNGIRKKAAVLFLAVTLSLGTARCGPTRNPAETQHPGGAQNTNGIQDPDVSRNPDGTQNPDGTRNPGGEESPAAAGGAGTPGNGEDAAENRMGDKASFCL